MSLPDINFLIESTARGVSKISAETKVTPNTQGSSSKPSTREILKDQGARLTKLEEEAREVISKAEKINTNTVNILVAIIGLFAVALCGIALDYFHNNYEKQKYFSSILEKYQTKEESKEIQQLFKDCINTYGLKFCISKK